MPEPPAPAALSPSASPPPPGPASLASPDPVDRYFELSLFFLLAVGFLTLAGTGKLDFFTLALMAGALAGRAILLWRASGFQLPPRLVSRITLFYIPFYFFDVAVLEAGSETILERILLATIHLVFFTAAVKMFSARSTRDYIYLASLAFCQMLAAATLTVQTSFLLYFGLFLLLAIMTFTSLEIKRSRARVEQESARFRSPREALRRLPSALSKTAAVISGGTAVMAVLLFFVIPRSNRGYFSSLAMPADRITGFSDEVDLGEIGQIKRLSSVVMHIQVRGLLPSRGLKWRGIGLTTFDGKRWFNRNLLSAKVSRSRSFSFRPEVFHPSQPPEMVRYTVTLQPVASDALFLALQPVELNGPFRSIWIDEASSIYLRFGASSLVRYTAVSDVAEPDPYSLRTAAGRIPPFIEETYLQLPPVNPKVRQMALDITRNQKTAYDKARAIEEYLQTNYGYTLDLPPAMPDDPIAYFLLEVRRGHCEFFASAMAIMLRTLGIPSRIVNGFLQGNFNDLSGQYTVRASDAHTWVEVYFPGYGWVPFDPTPAAGRSSQALYLPRLSLYLDAFQTFWEEWIINYDIFHQVTLARQVGRSSRDFSRESRRYFRRHYRAMVGYVRLQTESLLEHRGAALVVLTLLMFSFFVFAQRKALSRRWRTWRMLRNARRGKISSEDATLAYLRLLRLLERSGIRKAPAQTPTEFALSVPEPAGPLVRAFTKLYLHSRFGRFTDDPKRHVDAVLRLGSLLEQIHTLPRSPKPAAPRA